MKIIYSFILITILFCLLEKADSKPYRYPIMPGDSLWKKQITYEAKIKLCTIPDSVLKKISDEDLFETVLNFPFARFLVLNDNFLQTYNQLKNSFNGLNELMGRKNLVKHLFRLYDKDMSDSYLFRNLIIENLLAVPELHENLDQAEKRKLLQSSFDKFNKRVNDTTFLKFKSQITNSFLMIRLLESLDKDLYNTIARDNADIKEFCETSQYPQKQTVHKILAEIIKFK
ncbi:MAG: hypothetical protein NT007_08460 [Candidatus Kapabacteria bacterium]|nr:hypothetical protein [Candidatus Kapabacteria bacterium]